MENDCKKQGHQNGNLLFQTSEMLTLGARTSQPGWFHVGGHGSLVLSLARENMVLNLWCWRASWCFGLRVNFTLGRSIILHTRTLFWLNVCVWGCFGKPVTKKSKDKSFITVHTNCYWCQGRLLLFMCWHWESSTLLRYYQCKIPSVSKRKRGDSLSTTPCCPDLPYAWVTWLSPPCPLCL